MARTAVGLALVAWLLTDRALYGGVHEQVLRQVLSERGLFDPKLAEARAESEAAVGAPSASL